ncbi:uncharacterized protein BJ212DRAFT_1479246 [Suillus subaureus]|uniref:DUF6532 domain-containing protein n=1 Tax=Suillus subaureus TaxID=48587 RepID=A0A9P7JF59_9AGAM|nr:uncharacterized protein BJ212DRAFT_1479246 [Suillus subaureus]KAG1819136.1 hypothetical protein BJ212DRAFT_1479246 [Suillus subaureus]
MPAQRAGSPKKRKTKHKAVDSDLGKTLGSIEEKANKAPTVSAGKGGRNSQLERISALLEAPGRATKPKGSTTLDSNVPVNPLTPLPPSKGHGSHSKAPPLYSASQPVVDSSAPPPRKQGKKSRRLLPLPPASRRPINQTLYGMKMILLSGQLVRKHKVKLAIAAPPSRQLARKLELNNTDEESDKDNGEIGWGGVHGSHSVHPGFSKEGTSVPQPQAVALPSDFEFQHLQDEDKNVAIGSLTVDKTSSSSSSSSNIMSEPTKPEDVLQSYHKKNGHLRLPDPKMLGLIHCQETQAMNMKSCNSGVKAKVKSAKSKAPTEGPKPTQLSWYPPQWKTFLEEAKSECHVQHVIENAFLDTVKDLPLSVTEALMSSLIKWLEAGNKVEAGIWPEHKADTAKLLYEDLSTWHSDLKKIAISIMPSMYNLIPPAEVPPQARTAWVENAASELLDESFFLRDGVDDLGKTNNAAHPALKAAAVTFFYTGSYRITHRRPNVFKEELPLESLALVCTAYNCVFNGLIKNGSGKYFPKFTAKDYSSVYFSMVAELKNIMKHEYHGPKLTQQLHEWAAEGWAQSCKLNGKGTSKHHHLRVLLD